MREILIEQGRFMTRAVVLEEGKLAAVYAENSKTAGRVGEIYSGRVENVLSGLQAAFVDIGLPQKAFLHVQQLAEHVRTPIQKRLRAGQRVLVQVESCPGGDKGLRLTERITLPGMALVLTPMEGAVGVSRRIGGDERREALKAMVRDMLPEGIGAILRTAAADCTKAQLRRECEALLAQWNEILARQAERHMPGLLGGENALPLRVIRDHMEAGAHLTVQGQGGGLAAALAFIRRLLPECWPQVQHFDEPGSLMEARGLDKPLRELQHRRVWLKSGGFLLIERTQAMTVIDVNTGKFTGKGDFEDTILRTNLEAAAEAARQLRLRDVGGMVVIDFIDMARESAREQVLAALREAFAEDRNRVQVLGFTRLGLVELRRQRLGYGLDEALGQECPACGGTGQIDAHAWLLERACAAAARLAAHRDCVCVALRLPVQTVQALKEMEKEDALLAQRPIAVYADGDVMPGQYAIQGLDTRPQGADAWL